MGRWRRLQGMCLGAGAGGLGSGGGGFLKPGTPRRDGGASFGGGVRLTTPLRWMGQRVCSQGQRVCGQDGCCLWRWGRGICLWCRGVGGRCRRLRWWASEALGDLEEVRRRHLLVAGWLGCLRWGRGDRPQACWWWLRRLRCVRRRRRCLRSCFDGRRLFGRGCRGWWGGGLGGRRGLPDVGLGVVV